MALVNPNIAMSFRQPEFRPRNALAEYAQIQQIMGGQRQAEMADMQMEELRRERDALGRIQAAIVAKGGPPDLGAAADEMIRTGRPQFITQGQAILTALRNQRDAEAYRRDFGGGAAAPSAAAEVAGVAAAPSAPAAAPSATARAVFSQDAIADVNPEAQKNISSILGDAAQLRAQANEFKGSARASGFLNQAEQLENQAASMLAVQKRRASGSSFDTGAPATDEEFGAARQALAVGQAPPVNALAPAMPPAGVNQLASAGAAAPDANATRLSALEAQYRRIGNNPELASEKALLLKQIEAVLRGDQNRPFVVGNRLVSPTGQELYVGSQATASLSDRFVPVGKLVFDRQTEKFISPTQAQLTQSQERPAVRATEGSATAQPRPLTAVQESARRDKLGKEFKAATSALQTTQDVLDSIAFVKSEPGLSRATGYTGMLPSFPEGAAASAETRLANLKGKITALGKAAAASTGAIGSIANQEWKILSDQIAAIDPVKGKGPLLDQLALVEAQAQGAMARIQDQYQRQFGEDFERFPQFSNLPSPRSSFTPRSPAGGAGRATPAATGVDTNNPLLR